MAPGSCSTTRCLPPLLHFPSSTFKSSCNLCGNLPASAPLSSKLLPGSSQIRDGSILEPILPAGSGAGCSRQPRLNQSSSSSFFSHLPGPGPFPQAQGTAHLFSCVLLDPDNLVFPIDPLGFQLARQQIGILQTQGHRAVRVALLVKEP